MLSGSSSLALSLSFFFNSKIRCCNFLFVNAVLASHSHCDLTEQEAAFRISN